MTTTKTRPAEATSEFLSQVEKRSYGYQVDLTEPTLALRAALGEVPDPESLDRAIATVAQMDEKLARLEHLGSGEHVAALTRPAVSNARHLLRRALEPLRQPTAAERKAQADIEKAESEIAAATEALHEAQSHLAEAVELADIEAVARLRGIVEVTAPGRITEAHIQLVAARLALATAQTEPLAEQLGTAAAPLATAQATVDKARAQLEAAEVALQKIESDVATVETDSDRIHAEVARLTKERERLTAQLKADRRARTLRLAGLPDPSVTAEPVDPEPRNLIVTTPTEHFRG